jgi:hypothetical protein
LLVAGLPRALGHQPAEEVLLVGLAKEAPSLAVIIGTRLNDTAADIGPAALAASAMAAARRDGAQGVAVVVYAADAANIHSLGAEIAAAVCLNADRWGLEVLDALRVVGDRWASYLCNTPACCPPEGSPVTTPEGAPQ